MSTVIASFDIGTKNLAYCLVALSPDKVLQVLAWDVLAIPSGSYDLLPKRLASLLDGLIAAWNVVVNTVLIEKQPGRNKTMVRVEAYLHMYFVAKEKYRILLVSPKEKLKLVKCNFAGSSKEAYSLRKKAAIAATRQIVSEQEFFASKENQEASLKTFTNHKKKDDLADAFLQALSFAKLEVSETCLGNNDTDTSTRQHVFTSIKARKPTELQASKKKFSVSNIKYFMKDSKASNPTEFETFVGNVPGLAASICKQFPNVKQCFDSLKPM